MKVLLLHPADTLPWPTPSERWDLIIDFARAPDGTYENWHRQAGCPVLSLYQFAEEVDDLRVTRELLQLGTGYLADHWGIDWWDVLSLEIVAELRQLMLVHRLSKELDENCELYATRLHPLATALQRLLGARLTILESNFRAVIHRMRHYHEALLAPRHLRVCPGSCGQVRQRSFHPPPICSPYTPDGYARYIAPVGLP